MTSAHLVREARLRAGLTQTQLADRLGKAQSEIGRWERGEVTPSLETLRRIVRACGLELDLRLIPFDDSNDALLDQLLAMSPAERFAHAKERATFRASREHARAAA